MESFAAWRFSVRGICVCVSVWNQLSGHGRAKVEPGRETRRFGLVMGTSMEHFFGCSLGLVEFVNASHPIAPIVIADFERWASEIRAMQISK